jgi:hypothetical protein
MFKVYLVLCHNWEGRRKQQEWVRQGGQRVLQERHKLEEVPRFLGLKQRSGLGVCPSQLRAFQRLEDFQGPGSYNPPLHFLAFWEQLAWALVGLLLEVWGQELGSWEHLQVVEGQEFGVVELRRILRHPHCCKLAELGQVLWEPGLERGLSVPGLEKEPWESELEQVLWELGLEQAYVQEQGPEQELGLERVQEQALGLVQGLEQALGLVQGLEQALELGQGQELELGQEQVLGLGQV